MSTVPLSTGLVVVGDSCRINDWRPAVLGGHRRLDSCFRRIPSLHRPMANHRAPMPNFRQLVALPLLLAVYLDF
jgi:hypothetical protein